MFLINYSCLDTTIGAVDNLPAYSAEIVLSYISCLSIDIDAVTSWVAISIKRVLPWASWLNMNLDIDKRVAKSVEAIVSSLNETIGVADSRISRSIEKVLS
jgi:hypothetical protein